MEEYSLILKGKWDAICSFIPDFTQNRELRDNVGCMEELLKVE